MKKKILVYLIIYDSIDNIKKIIFLLKKLSLNIKFDLFLINHSNIDANFFNQIYDKINFINQKNTGYWGALRTIFKVGNDLNYTHIVHLNDDIEIKIDTLKKMFESKYFINSSLSGCELNSKNEIISFGCKFNYFLGKISWNKTNLNKTVNSFCSQGAVVSYPLHLMREIKIPDYFMYCEEIFFGHYFKSKKIKCYALHDLKFIHKSSDNTKINYKNLLLINKNRIRVNALYFPILKYYYNSILFLFLYLKSIYRLLRYNDYKYYKIINTLFFKIA